MYASFWLFSNVICLGVNLGQVFVNKQKTKAACTWFFTVQAAFGRGDLWLDLIN